MQQSIFSSLCKYVKPPSKLTVSQWADQYRTLSPESSAAGGKWRTELAPYQRGMMDVINSGVSNIVLMCSAQVGKTEIINNTVGYFIHQDPATILLLQPTLEMGNTWSKDRLAPMLRDTAALHGKIKSPRARDSGNTLLHKQFPGGHITIAGANSPASLASRPIRVVLCDEVDRYPDSAGSEGDPVELAKKRSTTFHNSLCILTSTPTVKNKSRIEQAFLQSDQRYYLLPCPHCQYQQRLIFNQLQWQLDLNKNLIPDSVNYQCKSCKQLFNDSYKYKMLLAGKWQATTALVDTAGFHINELYSPWVRWHEIVKNYLKSKDSPEQYKTWVNTSLGQTYAEEITEELDAQLLLKRRESFSFTVPDLAVMLTAGVDVQIDRLVCQVVAWSPNQFESWVMDYKIFPGNPAEIEVWDKLDQYLLSSWQKKNKHLNIAATFIDSGYQTQTVYRFCKTRAHRHVFAVKGMSSYGLPIASIPKRAKGKIPVLLIQVGTDTAKSLLFSRLKIVSPGPGYIHFPNKLDEIYFKELTAEHIIEKNGKLRWCKKQAGAPNEALDTYIYALAAIEYLRPNFKAVSRQKPKSLDNMSSERQNAVKFKRPKKSSALKMFEVELE